MVFIFSQTPSFRFMECTEEQVSVNGHGRCDTSEYTQTMRAWSAKYKWFRFIGVLPYIGSIDASLSYALLPIYMRLLMLMPSVLRTLHVINVCLSGIQLRAWRHEGNPNTQGERKAPPPPGQPYVGNGKRRRSPEGTNNLDNGYSTVFGRVKSLISSTFNIPEIE